jgi:hypothetical protein
MLRKSLLSATTAALLLSACEPADDAESFREGLPSTETVAVKEPGTSAQAIRDGSVQASAIEGQVSDLYKLTRGATVMVNGGTVFVLGLLENITEHAPTSIDGDTAIWGPHTGALARNTWKLSVTRTGDHTYSYKLEGKDKTAADSAFVTVLSGTHTAAVDDSGARLKHFGSGSFTVDWSAGSTLPERDNNVGSGDFTYSRTAPDAEASVSVAFHQVRDGETGQLVDADYSYTRTRGEGGEFSFGVNKNMVGDAQSQLERLTVKSRWQPDGAGRSDAKLTGGDLGTGSGTVNECWDTHFISRYYKEVLLGTTGNTYGVEGEACAFTSAAYASALP